MTGLRIAAVLVPVRWTGKQKDGFHPYGPDPPTFNLQHSLAQSAEKPSSKQGEIDMTKVYTLTVPVTFTKDGQEKTSYRRVGAVFENNRRDTGEVFFSIKLDFPVAVTELVAFPPRAQDGSDDMVE